MDGCRFLCSVGQCGRFQEGTKSVDEDLMLREEQGIVSKAHPPVGLHCCPCYSSRLSLAEPLKLRKGCSAALRLVSVQLQQQLSLPSLHCSADHTWQTQRVTRLLSVSVVLESRLDVA